MPPAGFRAEIERVITAGLQPQYKGPVPQVTVSVKKPSGYQFSVIGKVRNPGTFTPGRYVNALEALAIAGGPSEFANTGGRKMIRKAGDQLGRRSGSPAGRASGRYQPHSARTRFRGSRAAIRWWFPDERADHADRGAWPHRRRRPAAPLPPAPTEPAEPVRKVGQSTYVDLEAGAGYSTNPSCRSGSNTGRGFGRFRCTRCTPAVSARTTTVLSAYAQNTHLHQPLWLAAVVRLQRPARRGGERDVCASSLMR